MPTIETTRLILRDVLPSDWDALHAFLSDASVTRYMHFASWDEQRGNANGSLHWSSGHLTLIEMPMIGR